MHLPLFIGRCSSCSANKRCGSAGFCPSLSFACFFSTPRMFPERRRFGQNGREPIRCCHEHERCENLQHLPPEGCDRPRVWCGHCDMGPERNKVCWKFLMRNKLEEQNHEGGKIIFEQWLSRVVVQHIIYCVIVTLGFFCKRRGFVC